MQDTVKFNLLTGVPVECRRLKGKHQRILTEDNGKEMHEKLRELLLDLVVSIGDNYQPQEEDIDALLTEDKNMILWKVREFSVKGTDLEKTFNFTWLYTSDAAKTKGKELKHELEIDLTGLGYKPYMVVDADGKLVPAAFTNYRDVLAYAQQSTILPLTKREVRWNLLDGKGEALVAGVTNPSSHTLIEMRRPVVMHQAEKDLVPIMVDKRMLDDMEFMDIEHLRKKMTQLEGKVEAMIQFEHPEAKLKKPHEKNVQTNLLQQPAFFFPSEAL